jgi:hypothetical protein
MNTSEINQLIITDLDQFWTNTINPNHQDSVLKQWNFKSAKEALKYMKNNNSHFALNIVSNLFSHYLILKSEYLVSVSGTMLITNKRIFINQSQILSIPINSIRFYGEENNQPIVKYVSNEVSKIYYFTDQYIQTGIANNIIETHKHSSDLKEEAIQHVLTTPKTEFNPQELPVLANVEFVKPKKNFDGGIIALIVIVLCFGGCFYMMSGNDDRPRDYEALDRHEELKNRVTCSWCGGAGRVGYTGDSKAQTDRTGMGTGNLCTKCNGSGYVNK